MITITNLLLVALGTWNLYGRKSNPHQSLEDRARQVTVNLRSFLYVSMVMSIFFMTEAADDVYDLDFLDAFLMSVYFQVIALLSLGHALRGLKLQDINFESTKGMARRQPEALLVALVCVHGFKGVGQYAVIFPAGEIKMPPFVLIDGEAVGLHRLDQRLPVPAL